MPVVYIRYGSNLHSRTYSSFSVYRQLLLRGLSFKTSNPFNSMSSLMDNCGEGALISSGGSLLGIGSDISGSVRIPACFSSCVGFKPTSSRLSKRGLLEALPGEQGLKGSLGVMGRDVDIVTKCIKTLFSSEEMKTLDPTVVPLPWNETILPSKSKLRFGYFDTLEMFPTTPGVRRAIHMSKNALEKAGHEVIPFEMENDLEIYRKCITSVTCDDGATIKKHMEGEIVDPYVSKTYLLAFVSISMKPLYKKYIRLKTSSLAAEIIQSK
ncbi:Fatty acid amide hydrolase 1 [Armadillidium vulgare]|nr:Fatty acid amide hydrolase 1 [Armadillidium vulgare]